MDKILVRDLKLEAIIGLFPWEREVRQTLYIDLDIATDIAQAALSDDLQYTINYADVCDQVAALAHDGQFRLIETLAENIAQLVLSGFAADWVKVTVKKVDAIPQVANVGITIERSNE